MSELAELVRREILEQGPISFARFMELALYCPQLGYYERQPGRVGRSGDFYSSVSVGSLFGELLACQFVEWLGHLGRAFPPGENGTHQPSVAECRSFQSRPLQIVEAGSHDGRLALDILSWMSEYRSDALRELEYWIIEPSSARRAWQRQTLREFERHVQWFESWETISSASVQGVIFCNELLDAFPVRRIGWDAQAHTWYEWGVTWTNDRFDWCRIDEPHSQDLRGAPTVVWPELPAEFLRILPDGFTTEISAAAETWWRQAAEKLGCGWLLTIDYGLSGDQFFLPERAQGTLRGYHEHHVTSDVLARIGEQDLTSHVNFSALQNCGERLGLRTCSLVPQAKFLAEIVAKTEASRLPLGAWNPQRVRQFQTLTHPEHLGRSFQVLVQSR
ncbi:MAG: SAM-dependent methyltransferase [Verrucomicrobia bacterium]|nr:SAM-dependent methyltransferase [Verrucomicrobiota bacterium]